MARPRLEIDFKQLDSLLEIQCTGEECAAVLDVSYDTLQRRVQEETGLSFAEYFKTKGSLVGKTSLRRRQYQKAMDGNVPMLIWLGKNWLGQSDSLGLTTHEIPAMVIKVQKDEPDQATE